MYPLKQNGGSDPDEYFIRFKNQLIRLEPFFDDDDWWERLAIILQFEYGNDDPGERSLLLTLLSLLIWGIERQIKLNEINSQSRSESFRGLIEQVNIATINIKYKTINDGISTGEYFDKKMFILFCELLIENIKKLNEYKRITEFIVERDSRGNVLLSEENFSPSRLIEDKKRWEQSEDNSWREVDPKKREEIIKAASSKRSLYPNYRAQNYANIVGPTILREIDRLPEYIKNDIDPNGPYDIISRLVNQRMAWEPYDVSGLDLSLTKRGRLREAILYLESFNEQFKIEMWGVLNNPSELSYDKIKEAVIYELEEDYRDIFKSDGVGGIMQLVNGEIQMSRLSFDIPVNNSKPGDLSEIDIRLWENVARYNVYTQKIVETAKYIISREDDLINEIKKFKTMIIGDASTKRYYVDSVYNYKYDLVIEDIIRQIISSTCYIKYLLIKKYEDIGYDDIELDDEYITYGEDFYRLTNQTSKSLEIFWNSYFLDVICGTSEYKMTEDIPYPPTDTSTSSRARPRVGEDDSDDSDDSDDYYGYDAMASLSSEGGAKKLVELKEIKIPMYPYLIKKIFAKVELLKESLKPSPINPPFIPQYFLYSVDNLKQNIVPNPGVLSQRGGISPGDNFIDTKYTLLVEKEIKQLEYFRKVYEYNRKEKESEYMYDPEIGKRKKELISKIFSNPTWDKNILLLDELNKSETILASNDLMVMNEFDVIFQQLSIRSNNIPLKVTRILYGDYEKVFDLMKEGSLEKYVYPKGGKDDQYSSIDEDEYSVVWPERHEYLKNINKTEKTYDDYLLDGEYSPEDIQRYPEEEKIPGIIYEDSIRENYKKEIMTKLIERMLKSKNLSTELKPFTPESFRKPLKRSPTRMKGVLLPTIGEGVGVNKRTWKINPLRENDYDFYVGDGFYMSFDEVHKISENCKYILSLSKTEREEKLDEIIDLEGSNDKETDVIQNKAYAEILKRSIRDFEYNDEELMNEYFIKINELKEIFDGGNPDSLKRIINIVYTNDRGEPILNIDGNMIKSDVINYMDIKDDFVNGVKNSEVAAGKMLPFLVGKNEEGELLFSMEPFASISNIPKYNIDYFENEEVSLLGAPSNIRDTARGFRNVSDPDYSSELGYDPRSVSTLVTPQSVNLDKDPNETYTEYYNRIGYRYKGGSKKKKTKKKSRKKKSKKLQKQITRKKKSSKKSTIRTSKKLRKN